MRHLATTADDSEELVSHTGIEGMDSRAAEQQRESDDEERGIKRADPREVGRETAS